MIGKTSHTLELEEPGGLGGIFVGIFRGIFGVSSGVSSKQDFWEGGRRAVRR